MKKNKKINCIIDTDPGVDDSVAVILSLYDKTMDIKLITTVSGNLELKKVTRNALHILEKFNRTDIPLACGAVKPMVRESKDAKFIHQNEGLGGYIPPETVKTKPIEKSAVEAMYETICKYKNDIVLFAFGPHTNIAYLIEQHPDVIDMINHIYCEGCAPYGLESEGERWKNYISFNVSSDPEAFEIVINSGIPITIIPSRMGRDLANFNEEEVKYISEINDTGKFIAKMYSEYWEHGYKDRRIATNDTCACLIMLHPKIFKTKKCFFTVNTTDAPGKTLVEFNRHGNINYAYKVNRKKLHKIYFDAVRKMKDFKFYDC